MVTLAERISDPDPRRSRRLPGPLRVPAVQDTAAVEPAHSDRVPAAYPQSSIGIPACEINYPGAAPQPHPSASTEFRPVNATSGFGSSPNAPNPNSINTYQFVMSNPEDTADPAGAFFLLDNVIFAVGGAVVGVATQAATDLAAGHWSSRQVYAGDAVGGAVGGALLDESFSPELTGGAAGAAWAGSATVKVPVATGQAITGGGSPGVVVGPVPTAILFPTPARRSPYPWPLTARQPHLAAWCPLRPAKPPTTCSRGRGFIFRR